MRTTILFAVTFILRMNVSAQSTVHHPVNDRFLDIKPVELPGGSTILFTSDNTGATIDDDFIPGSIADINWGVASVWHAFHINTVADVTLNYCGTDFAQPGAFADYLFPDRPDAREAVPANTIFPAPCGDGNYAMTFNALAVGTYYVAVGYIPSIAEGEYALAVTATPPEATGHRVKEDVSVR